MRSWILNTDTEDHGLEGTLSESLLEHQPIAWPAIDPAHGFDECDIVYLWHPQPPSDGAIVAKGVVVGEHPPGIEVRDLRFTADKGRVPRVLLLSHPRLRHLRFLRQDGWSVQSLDDEEAKDMETVWAGAVPQRFHLL